MFLGAQGVDGALGRGDAQVSPVILSDFHASEKEETNPLNTAILNTLFICKIFGGSRKNKNIFPFDNASYKLFFILRPISERKASGILILLWYNFKSSAVLLQSCWKQHFITIQPVQNILLQLILINKI